MGNDISGELLQEIDDLEFKTPFNRPELKSLARRFNQASKGQGFLNPEQFKKYLGLDFRHGPIIARIFADVDTSGDGEIGFSEFVSAHAVLGSGSLRDKLLYCFDLFDVDRDGKLSRDEAVEMINCMSSSFASYILSVYGNPEDPRSPARLSQKKKQAAAGKALVAEALSRSGGGTNVERTLDTLFNTADSSGDDELDRDEFVDFLKQFPTCFQILECFKVERIKEHDSTAMYASSATY